MKQPAKKKKKRSASITLVVLLVLIAVVCVKLVQVNEQLGQAKSEQADITRQLEQQKQENDALQSDLSKANDKEFIKGLAKDELGLAEEGERIFYDVNH